MSHALRHEPWLYELELDSDGWVPVTSLLAALHEQGDEWADVGRPDLEEMIRTSAKVRHELHGDKIRALYGHSVPGRLRHDPAEPPADLFHGTSPGVAERILREGLKPMGRQYVHLSTDLDTARQVGRRKSPNPVILAVQARSAAARGGVAFYRGNDVVWLADEVPAEFIAVSNHA